MVLAIFGVIVISALFTLFLRAHGHLNMPPSRPHIIVDDLRIGWGARVLMEHVTFQVERGTTLRDPRRIRVAARARCCAT